MNIDDIKNILNDKELQGFVDNGLRPTRYKKNYSILHILELKYGNLITNNEFVYLLRNSNKLDDLHIFCTCGKKNKFINALRGYNKFCSAKCSATNEETKYKREITNQYLYGKKNVSQVDYLNINKGQKIKSVSKESTIKRKQTKQRLYGNPGYHNIEKMKKTNLKRYGVEYNWASKDSKLNGRKTREEKYGNPFYRDLNKTRKTNLERYGVEWCLQLPEVNNMRNCKEIRDKMENTKRKNGTSGDKSKPELRSYNLIKTKFKDAIHHYFEDSRYPFNCDIYIPNLDLFVECHYGAFHYIEPFDENNLKHIERLNTLKEKEQIKLREGKLKTKYTGMIRTWTVTDPIKLKTFIDNKLNYKIFYTEKEFNEWFNSLS